MPNLLDRRTIASGVAAVIIGTSSGGLFQPANADDFYKGKNLTILLGHPPGGSYDGYAQIAAQHYGKHIPGNPNVIVQHMPGGGGGKAALYFFTKAPTDGSMIALLPETLPHTQLMDPKRGRWDMRKINYIGSFAPAHSVLGVRKDTGVTKVAEIFKKTLKVGCTGRTSQSSQVPLLIKNLDGAKFEMVCGYRGSGPYMLAMERGEVNAISLNWATWSAKLMDKVKSGEYIPLMQTGLKRGKDSKDIPLIQEVVGNAKSKPVYAFTGAGARIGRALFGAPGMPGARTTELRSAFDKLVADKAFEQDVRKRGFLFDPATGAELDEVLKEIMNTPKEVIELASKGMSLGYKKACINCTKKKKKE